MAFADAAAARRYLDAIARDAGARAVLRQALSEAPGINTQGASDDQVLTWLAQRLARGEYLIVDHGEVGAGAGAGGQQQQQQQQQQPAPPVQPRVFDLLLVSVSPHFAPGETIYVDGDTDNSAAGETCTIQYRVIDPSTTATSGTLEILRTRNNRVLHRVDLTAAQYRDGRHTFEWDGRCNRGPATYPFVHLLHSPYTVRITVNGLSQKQVTGETAVLLEELTLERGKYTINEVAPLEGTNAHYQYQLTQMGYHLGAIDGGIGSSSRRAIRALQRSTGYLRVNGRLDDFTKAAIDHTAPSGTGTAHYQWILNFLGFRCGRPDGTIGAGTRRAIRRYKTVRTMAPIDENLDDAIKQRLDAEALNAIPRRTVLQGDDAHADVADNPLPAAGATKKIWIDCDGCWSPDGMPAGKWRRERDRLIRPQLPVIARPLVKRKAGGKAHAPQATGAVRVEFTVDTTAPPADHGVPHATARAFVQRVITLDGGTNATGHHLHRRRGGVRTASNPGVFRTGRSLEPYNVSRSGTRHRCDCSLLWNEHRQGTAGVWFRPSTIGGDRFSLIATVANRGFDTPPPATVNKQTGTFVIWRRYRLGKRWLMGYVTQPHHVQNPKMSIQPYYSSCFIEFVDFQAPNPTMLVGATPANQVTRTGGDEIVDLGLYRAVLRAAGYNAAQLSDAQITARYNASRLYALTPAATWNNNWTQYRRRVSDEIDRYETRLMRSLRDLSGLESPEGVVCLVIARTAPAPNTHQIPPGHNAPAASRGWSWSVFSAHRTVILLQNADDFESTAPLAQTGTLANAETLTFANSGEFLGVPAASRQITFAAGNTQAQVVAAIGAHATISQHVSADTVDLDAANAASPEWFRLTADRLFDVNSDKAAAATSTGLGTAHLVANNRGRVIAGTAQTGPLAAQEVLTFVAWGVFGGLAADPTITLAAGLTQAQVVSAINADAAVSARLLATVHNGRLLLTAKGQYTMTSNRAGAATSSGMGTVAIREGGIAETMAHEVGHALYMRHASTTNGQNADNPREHNRPEWQICNMSYINMDHFCGKCVLKLRGANETTLRNL